MEAQRIKIELDLTPEIAFFLCIYLNSTVQRDYTLQEVLTESGIKKVHEISQSIMNQLTSKTDFDNLRLRSILSSLKNLDDIDLQNELGDLLN